MYEHIYWAPEPFTSFAQANPHLYDRTITINGVSKAYAMTGWRIGYCGGPKEIIAAMATVQGQSTSNASSISQRASTVALNGDQSCVGEMNKAFKARHDFVVAGLNAIPGISCLPGAGTFYAFANVEGAMRTLGTQGRQRIRRISCWRMPVSPWFPDRGSARPITCASLLPAAWRPSRMHSTALRLRCRRRWPNARKRSQVRRAWPQGPRVHG